MSKPIPMKQQAFDAANGTFAVSVVTATVAGWTVQEWAAAAALFYSMVLIVDKFFPSALPFLRGLIGDLARLVWTKVVRSGAK